MTESGHEVQIVNVTDTHLFELDENALEQVLMKEDIKDLPVVVVSVAGAYRGGKSFLLNFFLRYLTSPQSSRDDGSWLGDYNEPLRGFNWRSGIERTTMGVLMWSEPIVSTLPSGDKVAVILIDTQGTFDDRSTYRDCSTVFALSTLLSSVQIYNLSQNIQEDDLQHLQLFTRYGSMVKDQGSKAFQELKFLVRDWQFPFEYSYGATGGQRFLEEKLKITQLHSKEMQDLRKQIRSSYEKVSCFLMPHPGFKVLRPEVNGNIADISIDFRTHLKELVKSLFVSENLIPKTINGERIRAQDLLQYFKTYMELFNSGTIPNPDNIFVATKKAGLLSLLHESREIYEKGMNSECGPKLPSVPASDLQDLHDRCKAAALKFYLSKRKMGSEEEANANYQDLSKELENRLPLFVQSNLAKIQTAINKAKEAYEEIILNIGHNEPLCVHPLDLEKVHNRGLEAAIKIFDDARKKLSNKNDVERDQFIKTFEKRNDLLRLSNDQNNKILVSTLRMEYWQYMEGKSAAEPALSVAEYKHEHEFALNKALENFNSKRNIPSNYTEDVYKYNMIQAINESFISLKAMNTSKNKVAMQAAVEVYNEYMKTVWDVRSQCLHQSELEREHKNGMCRALVAFRPRKVCSDGFDSSDEDEITLMKILLQRYNDFKTLNESANKTAVQEAFNVYVTTMEDLCRPTLWWILIYPIFKSLAERNKHHEQAKAKAVGVFDSKRRGGSQNYSDAFKNNLEQMMNECYTKMYAPNALIDMDIITKHALPAIMSVIKGGA